MIHYSPVNGDVRAHPVNWRPKSAFIMQQLGTPIPPSVRKARRQIDAACKRRGFLTVDAASTTTGRDYLDKIWDLVLGCPVGVAIIHETISPSSLANIYYELGLMHALGRETLVVPVGNPEMPSDLVRTEYLPLNAQFKKKFSRFVMGMSDRAEHYLLMANNLEKNPLLAADYLRRASMLNGDRSLVKKASTILSESGIGERGKSSVEALMLSF